MGAWIEITTGSGCAAGAAVAPVWGRGLKLRPYVIICGSTSRPRMGAWIEIIASLLNIVCVLSPPYGGVD